MVGAGLAARLADGAPGPGAAGAKRRADGRGRRTRVLLRHAAARVVVEPLGARFDACAPSAKRDRSTDRHRAIGPLRVQARAPARRGVRIAAEVEPPGDPRESCRGRREGAAGDRRRLSPSCSPITTAWRATPNRRCDTGSSADNVPGAGRPTSKQRPNFRRPSSSSNCCRKRPSAAGRSWRSSSSLGLCFIAVRGYSADDTRKSFERACALSAQLGEPQKEIRALFGLWGHYWMRARHDRAIELAETLLARAELLRDPIAVVVGHRAIGSTLFTRGDFVRAQEHLERAISLGAASEQPGPVPGLRGGPARSPPS